MTDRLQAYEVFVALVERKSFTETSKALGIPQPTISKHIASLESTLGLQLFVRTTRRTIPTSEALEILPNIRQMLEANEEIKRKARGKLPEVSGTLRLDAPPAYVRHVLLPHLARFREAYPLVELELVTGQSLSDLAANEIDLALTDSDRLEGPHIQRLVARHAWQIGASLDHVDRFGMPMLPTDLEQRAVIVPTARTRPAVLEFESETGHVAVQVSAPVRCDDIEVAMDIAVGGDALVVAPDWLFAGSAYRDEFRVVLPDYVLKPAAMRLIYPATQFLPTRTRALIDFLSQALRTPTMR